ncbi:uncharacterized protein METZ01_LOCUS303041, partial [marine metagenome]
KEYQEKGTRIRTRSIRPQWNPM